MAHTQEDIRLMYEQIGELKSRLSECERERDEYRRVLDIAIKVINESVPMPWHTDPKAIQDCINEIREFKQSLKSENNGNVQE